MKHEKTFEAISKLKDVEFELHRLKNALEMANKALDSQCQWVGLTDEETETLIHRFDGDPHTLLDEVNARLKEKNT